MQSTLNLDTALFLREYWQKKPLVIKNAFSTFTDPVDEHQLAGLAMEEDIDSRIVVNNQDQWQVHHGPFEDFTSPCQHQWSLLVQSVDHYVPEVDQLLQPFQFIPQWRLDDVMISFSVTGAGVGPHLDQYDVFIVQGKGRRRWQVAEKGQYDEVLPCADLRQIKGFANPIIDEVLEPGDLIYIPPGFPHNGVALEDCLNYSVGFRAPDQATLLSSFADYLLDQDLGTDRYKDPSSLDNHPSSVQASQVEKVKSLMHSAIDDTHFEFWLRRFLSQSNAEAQPLAAEDAYSVEDITHALSSDTEFVRQGGLKIVTEPEPPAHQQVRHFYINSQAFDVDVQHWDEIEPLLLQRHLSIEFLRSTNFSVFFVQTLTTLVNAGYWYPVECGELGDDV